MLTADYLIANEDRHFNNFGLFRDPDTLEFVGFAPLYDNGTSLCYNRNAMQFDHYESKPFYTDCEKQLLLVTSLMWFSPEKADAALRKMGDTLNESIAHGFITDERAGDGDVVQVFEGFNTWIFEAINIRIRAA